MKVKLSLVLALSHGAELLILDEPTSGLDPVSRNELLETFRHLKEKGISILFSTHIISDLEKCADEITYIRNGKLIYTGNISGFAGEQVSLEDAMVQYEKEGIHEKFADERV
jgi:ABC-2 type transport system ATP-binding protein